ncbi:MAG: hypothetical protein AB4911_15565 [Oscillochloridaceae bacterium umkhey_bin13]
MPYRMLEEFQSRRKEKVAAFLTFENIIGLILVTFPFFVASAGFPLLIRAPLVIGAAGLGILITLDVGGLPLYEQVLWRIRGLLRRRMHGDRLTPEVLSGAAPVDSGERPLPLDGPVQLAHRRPRLPELVVAPALIVAPRRRGEPEGDHADY